MPPTAVIELSGTPNNPFEEFQGLVKKVVLEVIVDCPHATGEPHEVVELTDVPQAENRDQLYQCVTCHRKFTWRSSRFFVQGKNDALMEVTAACLEEGRTETALAGEIGVSQSHISRLVTTTTQAVLAKEVQLQTGVHFNAMGFLEQQPPYFPVITDETFLSASGQTFYPIWTVDGEGHLLHYDWLERRTDETISQYIATQREVTGPTAIQVHDGLRSYQNALEVGLGEPIEIVHLHRAPRGRVLILGRERTPTCECTALHILGIHTRNLHGPGPALGWYAVKITRCETHACLCKKELCLEGDHLYLCQACQEQPFQIEQEHKWQLTYPQMVFKEGIRVEWERPLSPEALPFIPFSMFEKLPERLSWWCSAWAQTLLAVLYQCFPSNCPTTNRIERQNGLFKDHKEWRGRRRPHHVKAWFLTWIALKYHRCWLRQLCSRITRRVNLRVIFWTILRQILPSVRLFTPPVYQKG